MFRHFLVQKRLDSLSYYMGLWPSAS
uniref:Uncharacterized protein n=1 Tax=Arundo donax TaxID=35708 RepID=A0A0A9ANQ7_ARUDO